MISRPHILHSIDFGRGFCHPWSLLPRKQSFGLECGHETPCDPTLQYGAPTRLCRSMCRVGLEKPRPVRAHMFRSLGSGQGSFAVAALAAIAISGTLHQPEIDGSYFRSWLYLGGPLTIAWSIAGLVACAFWPNPSFNPDAPKRAA